jgi:iron complex outermembrane receptor protein
VRHIDAVFTEFAIPLVGDPANARLTPRLELSIAGRYERYSDFGSTENPKIGLRWSPTEHFRLRGSWGTSFRAPRVTDLLDTSRDRAGLASLADPDSPTGRSLVLAIEGSNPDLHEEKAHTWTIGFDTVFPRLRYAKFSGTYFATSYQQRITAPAAAAPFDILRQGERWQAVVERNPTQGEIDAICASPGLLGSAESCRDAKVAAIVDYRVRNLSATEASGLDFRFELDTDTPIGPLSFDLQSSFYLRLDQSVAPGSPFTSELDTIGNPMRRRHRAILQWSEVGEEMSGFNAAIFTDYSSAYRDIDTGRPVSALTTVSTRLGLRTAHGPSVLSDLELSLNVANVFNRHPPFVNRESGYDALNTSPYGRVWNVMVEKRWW